MPRTRRKNLETGDKSREPNACIRIGNSWEATRDSQPNPRRKRGYTHLEEYPDYWTQGETLDVHIEHLKDLYLDLSSGQILGIRKVGELAIP